VIVHCQWCSGKSRIWERYRHSERGSASLLAFTRDLISGDLLSENETKPAVRSVTLNLVNKFSQCTFSVAEHYGLFSGLFK